MKKKYSFEQRMNVVNHYLNTDDGYRVISSIFGVPRTQVRAWIAIYQSHGEEGLRPKDKRLSSSPDLRVEVVMAVINKNMSQNQAAVHFKLSGAALVSRWVKIYTEYGEDGLRSLQIGRKRSPKMSIDPAKVEAEKEKSKDKRIESLEKKVRALELRVTYLKKLKALAQ